MPRGSLLGDDEELGKKDDDYHAGHEDLILTDLFQFRWLTSDAKSLPRTRRRRRAALAGGGVLAVILLLVLLLRRHRDPTVTELRSHTRQPYQVNLDNLDLDSAHAADLKLDPNHAAAHQLNSDSSLLRPHASPRTQSEPKGVPPSRPETRDGRELQYYNGPLTWHALLISLQATTQGRRGRYHNRNVLFAAAHPQSFARLAPMACEMSRWQRTVVHFAIMGRHELKIEELKRLNGIDDQCEVVWHDARPDYAAYSTDDRFRLAVTGSLEYVQGYLQPKVILIDQPSEEDRPFVVALEDYAIKSRKSVIRLPTNAAQNLKWVTRLDSGSLAAWQSPEINILIRAPVGNGNALVRLLKSIQSADYFGVPPPHLTIELPPDMEPRTERWLENFAWPPFNNHGEQYQSHLTLRRRLPQQRIGISEASMRLIESFYPSRTKDSHVLLLAAEVELSPLFYHYLLYNLLEYKYSSYNVGSRESEQLLGISLFSPTYLLDGKSKLLRPTIPVEGDRDGRANDKELTIAAPFLWQAPDTYATLYFGDKWKQLLFYLNTRLRRTDLTVSNRQVTTAVPAFAEYFLELMRARGWFILYPHLPGFDFATKHNEAYQVPEEFFDTASAANEPPPANADPFYHPGPVANPVHKEEELVSQPLDILLPSEGDLSELVAIPLLSYNGQKLTATSANRQKQAFAQQFRSSVGNCPDSEEQPEPTTDYSADDLFCESESALRELGTPPAPGQADSGLNRLEAGRLGTHYAGSKRPPSTSQWVDEDGDWLPLPISDAEQRSMKYEFAKHLERQKDRSG